jgi:Preprotein translocase subunit SecA (ATPase, RNA helicase)
MVKYHRFAATIIAISSGASICDLLYSTDAFSLSYSNSISTRTGYIGQECRHGLISTNTGAPVATQTSRVNSLLQMGVVEDFLAGTDNEKRKKDNEKYLETLNQRVEKMNALEPSIEDLGDDELLAKTEEFRNRLQKGEDINGPILEEAFAVVREAAW